MRLLADILALDLALCRPLLRVARILLLLRLLALCRPLLRAALIILLMSLALSRPWLLWRRSLRLMVASSMR